MMSITLELQEHVLTAVDARTCPHSFDTDRNGIASRDLSRYYALVKAGLRAVENKFTAAERMAVIATLQGASHHYDSDGWTLPLCVEDALEYEALAEHHKLDAVLLLEKVRSLSKAEMVAFDDAAERWWNAASLEQDPEYGDLFVGIPSGR